MTIRDLVFDLSSARTFDEDGRMHVTKTRISKANACEYWGREIPNWEALKLSPNKIYSMYRHPDALARAADSFARQPLLMGHHDADASNPHKQQTIGAVGSNVAFDGIYLTADIAIWDGAAIAAIQSGKVRELSCAYRYTAVMQPGTAPDGTAYDGIMTDIVGSHLALVEEGRAGHDVRVADEQPDHMEKDMENEKVMETQTEAVAPEVAPAEAVGAEVDVDVAPEGMTDAIEDDEETLMLDEEPPLPEVTDKDKIEQAKDELREEFRAANIARAKCRHIVGDALNCDTAEDIYRLALDTMGVKHDALFGHAALGQMFDAVAGMQDRKQAHDSKLTADGARKAAEQFPGLSRFCKI